MGYIVFREILFQKQMHDVLDRFMSRNLTEYKATEMVPEDKENTISHEDPTIPLDEADNPFVPRKVVHA